MPSVSKISHCLWFDSQAEEAANFYVSIFPDSQITQISRYSAVGQEFHGRPPGSVLMVEFHLAGQRFQALNGGPVFVFNEAISLSVDCQDQAEVDYYWERLGAGGDERAQQCGWLKDKFSVSWQVVPHRLQELVSDHTSEKSARAMAAMFQMKKLDIATLQQAYDG